MYSGGGGGNRLDITDARPGVVSVRDGKNPDDPKSALRTQDWAAFVEGVASTT
ncbi:DUF397 domain-containing protein [Streptomyces sp. NPDC057257]|uniref:DUF397 domain-containing protein n=1 Tax=Streptomyces sp. NPDC057257 TaxID=3346071 RepID=UPI0036364583